MSNSLDPDQARQNIRPDLDPNCLQTFLQTTLVGNDQPDSNTFSVLY